MTARRRGGGGGVFGGRQGSVWEGLSSSFWFIAARSVLSTIAGSLIMRPSHDLRRIVR